MFPKRRNLIGEKLNSHCLNHVIKAIIIIPEAFIAQLVKNPPAMQETLVQSLGWKDPMEKGKATDSSILAWRIPWTTVHGVAKSQTRPGDLNHHHMHVSVQ